MLSRQKNHEAIIPGAGAGVGSRDSSAVHHRKRTLPANTNLPLPSWNNSNSNSKAPIIPPSPSQRNKSPSFRFARQFQQSNQTAFVNFRSSACSIATCCILGLLLLASRVPFREFTQSRRDIQLLLQIMPHHKNSTTGARQSAGVALPQSSLKNSRRYYGINYVSTLGGRNIDPRDHARYQQDRISILEAMDKELDVNSEHERVIRDDPTRYEPYDELYQVFANRPCQRPKWSFQTNLNCNVFHQITVDRTPHYITQEFAIKYLSEGSFRMAWLLQERNLNQENVVMKNLRLPLQWNALTMKQVHLEALVMSQTLDSKATADIYGHCGTSILVETGQSIRNSIFYSQSLMSDKDVLRKQNKYRQISLNDLTDEQRLKMAVQMAESLAALHGNVNGVIVNDDLQVFQWVVCKDGDIKLNDFNNAIIMEWNSAKNEYCKFVGEFESVFRSPQENTGEPTDESTDVHVLGSMYYNILTGLIPFYEREKNSHALKALVELKEKPYIHPSFRNGTMIQRSLVNIMEACWNYESKDRPSIFTVLKQLRETVKQYEKTYKDIKIEDIDLKPLGRPL